MQNVNPQQMTGNGYIMIPKLMFAEYINSCDRHEGDVEAFLKLLLKVNYSETEYTDYWHNKSCAREGRAYVVTGVGAIFSTGRQVGRIVLYRDCVQKGLLRLFRTKIRSHCIFVW